MTTQDDILGKLARAQAAVERAERDAGMSGIVAMLFITSDRPTAALNDQRAERMAPARAALEEAIAERDRYLGELGWCPEEWLKKWEDAKARAEAPSL